VALALVPHAADAAGRLHLWVGVANVRPAPALSWKLDGRPVEPIPLRPLTPVLTDDGAAHTVVHTGFFELSDLPSRTPLRVEVTAGNERIERWITVPPPTVPDGPQDHFNVLLLSCFHQHEDKSGKAGEVLSRLGVKPDLTLFAGDQVYLDLPTLADFKDDGGWLRNKFQNDYLTNWFGDGVPRADATEIPPGYPRVLTLAPGAFMPDDHEYWNNYPFSATVIQNSWVKEGRDRWAGVAEVMYHAFQENPASPLGAARIIDVPPLSILMLDTRSQRSRSSRANGDDLLGAPGHSKLQEWITRLVDHAGDEQPLFGMLVTGQSFFSPAAGAAKGAIADYEYPDYKPDYTVMVKQIERLTRAGLPVILATGEDHWGRMLSAVDPVSPAAPVFEVISSPTALVSSVGIDEAKRVWGAITGLFGPTDPFPRHADPANPPQRFGSISQYTPTLLSRTAGKTGKPAVMRGDQAFMLRFARMGTGLDVGVTCYPLSGDLVFDGAEQWSTTLQLRPPRT
jgi:hypothetical protein